MHDCMHAARLENLIIFSLSQRMYNAFPVGILYVLYICTYLSITTDSGKEITINELTCQLEINKGPDLDVDILIPILFVCGS